jgi:hypothetical protein
MLVGGRESQRTVPAASGAVNRSRVMTGLRDAKIIVVPAKAT